MVLGKSYLYFSIIQISISKENAEAQKEEWQMVPLAPSDFCALFQCVSRTIQTSIRRQVEHILFNGLNVHQIYLNFQNIWLNGNWQLAHNV